MNIDSASYMGEPFAKVKQAFESTYECMGITCADVGGLWLAEDYHEGAAPCYEKIVGYEPHTDVVPHSMIDLDQKEFETHLKVPNYALAKDIYMKGGNSGGKAVMTVGALAAAAAKGAEVKQGAVAVGKMKSAAAAGDTSITVSYKSMCKDGGASTKDLSGCFTVAGGDITIGGNSAGAPTAVTNKYRTLMGFSSNDNKLKGEPFFEDYVKYYDSTDGDYAHKRVMDALDQTGICAACDDDARVQIAKKTSAYMNVWMYVIHEFEDAIADCNMGCIL
jgi:hypothetical protein